MPSSARAWATPAATAVFPTPPFWFMTTLRWTMPVTGRCLGEGLALSQV
ncbi:hypothetical protein SMICM17S_08717 [Streptomyces microflavus]